MFCAKCGSEIKDTAKFCPNCGATAAGSVGMGRNCCKLI